MKTIIWAVLLMAPLAAWGAASIKADFPKEIAAQCAQRYPAASAGQGRCIDAQSRAALRFIQAYRASPRGSAKRRAMARCLNAWRLTPILAEASFDYRKAQWCAELELSAK